MPQTPSSSSDDCLSFQVPTPPVSAENKCVLPQSRDGEREETSHHRRRACTPESSSSRSLSPEAVRSTPPPPTKKKARNPSSSRTLQPKLMGHFDAKSRSSHEHSRESMSSRQRVQEKRRSDMPYPVRIKRCRVSPSPPKNPVEESCRIVKVGIVSSATAEDLLYRPYQRAQCESCEENGLCHIFANGRSVCKMCLNAMQDLECSFSSCTRVGVRIYRGERYCSRCYPVRDIAPPGALLKPKYPDYSEESNNGQQLCTFTFKGRCRWGLISKKWPDIWEIPMESELHSKSLNSVYSSRQFEKQLCTLKVKRTHLLQKSRPEAIVIEASPKDHVSDFISSKKRAYDQNLSEAEFNYKPKDGFERKQDCETCLEGDATELDKEDTQSENLDLFEDENESVDCDEFGETYHGSHFQEGDSETQMEENAAESDRVCDSSGNEMDSYSFPEIDSSDMYSSCSESLVEAFEVNQEDDISPCEKEFFQIEEVSDAKEKPQKSDLMKKNTEILPDDDLSDSLDNSVLPCKPKGKGKEHCTAGWELNTDWLYGFIESKATPFCPGRIRSNEHEYRFPLTACEKNATIKPGSSVRFRLQTDENCVLATAVQMLQVKIWPEVLSETTNQIEDYPRGEKDYLRQENVQEFISGDGNCVLNDIAVIQRSKIVPKFKHHVLCCRHIGFEVDAEEIDLSDTYANLIVPMIICTLNEGIGHFLFGVQQQSQICYGLSLRDYERDCILDYIDEQMSVHSIDKKYYDANWVSVCNERGIVFSDLWILDVFVNPGSMGGAFEFRGKIHYPPEFDSSDSEQ